MEKGEAKTAEAEVIPMSQMKEGEDAVEEVRVGEEKEGKTEYLEKGRNVNIEKEAVTKESVFVRKYKPMPEDVNWAQSGVVAIVRNGEAIPVVQNRIADAGFKELAIIPMGA
ncbi:DUF4283 domain protein, partial [Trifolium medium]|nr:DUF4283 domain protein [Trifolium medium]